MENIENSTQEIPEVSPNPEVVDTRLEIEYRDKLQSAILVGIGATAFDSNSAYEYGMEILDKISAIIDADTPEGKEIRDDARAGKYDEAVEKVIARLDFKKVEQKINPEVYTQEYEKIKTWFSKLFEERKEEGIEGLYSEIRFFAPFLGLDSDVIIKKIKGGLHQENPETFVATAFDAIKIFIDQKIEHPEMFEEARRERRIQRSEGIRLSELMYYNLDLENGTAILHVAPKGSVGLGGVLKSFRDGMKELAKQVKKDKRIQRIQATSWIVASNPGLLKKAGFTIDGPIDEKMKAQHFSHEERPVSLAYISREALLEKYQTN
jgi:hypothetical protein